jgi:hypothetical protein
LGSEKVRGAVAELVLSYAAITQEILDAWLNDLERKAGQGSDAACSQSRGQDTASVELSEQQRKQGFGLPAPTRPLSGISSV